MRKTIINLLVIVALLAILIFAWWRSPYHQVRTITTSVMIYAPTDRVWQVLTDFNAYPQWNPFIKQASGEPRQGARLDITLQNGNSTMHFRPRVLQATPGHELRWIGHFVVPGLFDGEHRFLLEPDGPNNTRLTQSETFDGILVVPLWKRIAPGTSEGFRKMNQALKDRAEAR